MHFDRLARQSLTFFEMALSNFHVGVPMQQVCLIGELLATLAGDGQCVLSHALCVGVAARVN
jgi:hypothetical protein